MNKNRFGNKIITLALALVLVLATAAPAFAANDKYSAKDYADAPEVAGTSVIMIDSASGDILYEKNSDKLREPASITKIMTCLLVLENMDLDQKITITEDSSPIGHNIEMKKGEVLTVEQLLYAMMLPSANDAARQLAIATAGGIGPFSDMMNSRAIECGAYDTNFTNPNGLNLPGEENHKTTAHDLAMIARVAMKNDTFREIVSTKKYTIPATNKSEERVLKSTDLLLYSKKTQKVGDKEIPLRYPLATGIKTGTTTPAGDCFVGAAKDDNMELIVVTLNSDENKRFTDAIQLFDYAFAKYDGVVAAQVGEEVGKLSVTCGKTGKVAVGVDDTLAMTIPQLDEGEEAGYTVRINPTDKKVKAPFAAGTVVGTVDMLDADGNVQSTRNAVTLDGVEQGGFLSAYGIPDDMLPLLVITLITIVLIIIVIVILRKRKKPANAVSEEIVLNQEQGSDPIEPEDE